MEIIRKPFTGITNIVRFNWHFYLLALFAIIVGSIASFQINGWWKLLCWAFVIGTVCMLIVSMFVSFYIYDCTQLYDFNWIKDSRSTGSVVNIHSGFDESSALLRERFPNADFIVWDFYNPEKHTESSIKRARKIYPSDGISIATNDLPSVNNPVEIVYLILAAHEIRNEEERIIFFKELNRILHLDGTIYVMEHLRDVPNFLAYSIGAFHFHSKRTWLRTFSEAGFSIVSEQKHTPFISIFKLQKDGSSF